MMVFRVISHQLLIINVEKTGGIDLLEYMLVNIQQVCLLCTSTKENMSGYKLDIKSKVCLLCYENILQNYECIYSSLKLKFAAVLVRMIPKQSKLQILNVNGIKYNEKCNIKWYI